jgi:hypothetical protein
MAHDLAMLAARPLIWIELTIAAAATAWLASTPSPKPASRRDELRVVHVELRRAPAKAIDCSAPLPPKLDAMYRDREFGAVANALGGCPDAQLMRQLERTYALATDADAKLEARYDAVRQALTDDFAFGGAHARELTDATKMIATRRMNELLREDDFDGARHIERTISALGD